MDWPGPGGVWGPWAPNSLPTHAELEWDPAGDVGGFGPLGQKRAWTPGAPCELCGHRGPQSRGQGLEVRAGGGHPHPGTHRRPLCAFYQGPSLSRSWWLCLSLSLSQCLFLSWCLSVFLPPSVSFGFSIFLYLIPSGFLLCLYIHFLVSSHSPPLLSLR